MNGRIELREGAVVEYGGARYTITHVVDLQTVLARADGSDVIERLDIPSLNESTEDSEPKSGTDVDLVSISEGEWCEASRRAEIVRSIDEATGPRTEAVRLKAREVGVHPATIYRWIRTFETTESVTSLLPIRPNGGKGKRRLDHATEEIVRTTIDDYYLASQQRSAQKTCEEIVLRCRRAGLTPPHPNTIRSRISAIDERVRLERRARRASARSIFTPIRGEFPDADSPLAVVQIDHTKVDLILVDDVYRRPIGRPWITVAIDVFSRVVLGFYASFDAPGALATGLCVAHAILPKDVWLANRGLTVAWPCWGVMRVLHLDNAREFRGQMLRRACQEHGIAVAFRPVLKPNYGGHIERLLGTFASEIHALPGTTFSSPRSKGEYDSKKEAAVSLSEFETWLATYITGVYHQREHSGIGTSPLARFESGIFGSGERPGTGLPARITDEERLRLDFMPFVSRTVQPYGVVVDGIHYYSDVLRRHVNARDPRDPSRKRTFTFKRDPRDISRLYFYDPDLEQYSAVAYRDATRPAISLWELREATRTAREASRAGIDETIIFATLERMREQQEESLQRTKQVRRSRRLRFEASPRQKVHRSDELSSARPSSTEPFEVITPFDELEEL